MGGVSEPVEQRNLYSNNPDEDGFQGTISAPTIDGVNEIRNVG